MLQCLLQPERTASDAAAPATFSAAAIVKNGLRQQGFKVEKVAGFARKREMLQLLERTLQAPGVRIFIGEETGLAPMDGISVVTAPYQAGGQVLGVLGVIGPTRMAYERVIPVVQAAADALGSALNPEAPAP